MLLNFDFSNEIPLYMQLRNRIVIGIAQGELQPGDKLPTIRSLAEELGINMMTVSKAYQLLSKSGYISAERRGGSVVLPRSEIASVPQSTLDALKLHLSELHLSGVSREEALELCAKLYDE